MGAYINPADESKEDFLLREGKLIPRPLAYEDIPDDSYLIALIDNVTFTAAGVAFNEQEFMMMTDPDEARDVIYYIVPKDVVPQVSDVEEYTK